MPVPYITCHCGSRYQLKHKPVIVECDKCGFHYIVAPTMDEEQDEEE